MKRLLTKPKIDMKLVFSIIISLFFLSCIQEEKVSLKEKLEKLNIDITTQMLIYEGIDSINYNSQKLKETIFNAIYDPQIIGPIKSRLKYKVYFLMNTKKIDSLWVYNYEYVLYRNEYYTIHSLPSNP
jgi:hypothetical protein